MSVNARTASGLSPDSSWREDEVAGWGHDKALLDWHGQTLLEHMVQLVSTSFDPVRIVGRGKLPDAVEGCGPLGGILTALQTSKTDMSFIAALDLPFLTREFLQEFRLKLERSTHPVVACRIGSRYPLCMGIRRELLAEVERLARSEDLSIHNFIENSNTEIVTHVSERLFQNLNTHADYLEALRVTDELK